MMRTKKHNEIIITQKRLNLCVVDSMSKIKAADFAVADGIGAGCTHNV
jgi:hypothetical protein